MAKGGVPDESTLFNLQKGHGSLHSDMTGLEHGGILYFRQVLYATLISKNGVTNTPCITLLSEIVFQKSKAFP